MPYGERGASTKKDTMTARELIRFNHLLPPKGWAVIVGPEDELGQLFFKDKAPLPPGYRVAIRCLSSGSHFSMTVGTADGPARTPFLRAVPNGHYYTGEHERRWEVRYNDKTAHETDWTKYGSREPPERPAGGELSELFLDLDADKEPRPFGGPSPRRRDRAQPDRTAVTTTGRSRQRAETPKLSPELAEMVRNVPLTIIVNKDTGSGGRGNPETVNSFVSMLASSGRATVTAVGPDASEDDIRRLSSLAVEREGRAKEEIEARGVPKGKYWWEMRRG